VSADTVMVQTDISALGRVVNETAILACSLLRLCPPEADPSNSSDPVELSGDIGRVVSLGIG
jgi:hypothetical protein